MSNNDCCFLFLTERCNLACAHCYVNATPSRGSDMNLETAQSALDLFGRLDIFDLRLTGGEPTIHPHFGSIIELAAHRGFSIGLVSNGQRLIWRERDTDVFERLSRCWISVYGTTPEAHSTVAGYGSRPLWEIVNRVGALAGAGYPVGISVLVRPAELGGLIDFVAKIAVAGVKRLRFLPLQNDGRGTTLPDAGRHSRLDLFDLATLLRSHPDALRFEVLSLNDAFGLEGRSTFGRESCLLRSRAMWSVVPDGSIFPCCFTAYTAAARIGSVHDFGIEYRVRAMHSRESLAEHCRGLENSFWPRERGDKIGCPIRSVDPRKIVSGPRYSEI